MKANELLVQKGLAAHDLVVIAPVLDSELERRLPLVACTRCGFSRKAVAMLQQVDAQFGHFDILTDQAVRQGLKEYSNWPTYPQLYVKGELIGGFDIIEEMKEAGELKDLVTEAS